MAGRLLLSLSSLSLYSLFPSLSFSFEDEFVFTAVLWFMLLIFPSILKASKIVWEDAFKISSLCDQEQLSSLPTDRLSYKEFINLSLSSFSTTHTYYLHSIIDSINMPGQKAYGQYSTHSLTLLQLIFLHNSNLSVISLFSIPFFSPSVFPILQSSESEWPNSTSQEVKEITQNWVWKPL